MPRLPRPARADGWRLGARVRVMLLAAAVLVAGLWGATHCDAPARASMLGIAAACTSSGNVNLAAPATVAGDSSVTAHGSGGHTFSVATASVTGVGGVEADASDAGAATLACVLAILCVLAWAFVLLATLPRFFRARQRGLLPLLAPVAWGAAFGSRGLSRNSLPALGVLRR